MIALLVASSALRAEERRPTRGERIALELVPAPESAHVAWRLVYGQSAGVAGPQNVTQGVGSLVGGAVGGATGAVDSLTSSTDLGGH